MFRRRDDGDGYMGAPCRHTAAGLAILFLGLPISLILWIHVLGDYWV